MITGAHSILYSTDAEADRAFLRDVLGLPNVDVGEGWLIFGLPPAEVAVHPSRKNDLHELYLICEDANAFVAEMKRNRIVCDPVQDMGWGLLTSVRLPGGGKLGVYEPKHARPPSVPARGSGSRGAASRRKAGRRSAAGEKSTSDSRVSARSSASRKASGASAGRGAARGSKSAKSAKAVNAAKPAKAAVRGLSSAGEGGAGARARARR